MGGKILFVDDDANILAGYKRQLRKAFRIETAAGGQEGLALLQGKGPFAVVISDMQMPEMSGLEFLRRVRQHAPDAVRMMLTGNADQKTAVDAVNEGSIFRFYTKPCPPEQLAKGIKAALEQHALVTAERELLERTLAGSVKVLVDVLTLVDQEAFGTTGRLRQWMQKVARQLKLEDTWELDLAAMLSPIGQVTIPAEVRTKLRKGMPLSASERTMVERAPEASRDLIANIPRLKGVAEIVHLQNKGFDGSGFPAGAASGAGIPLGSRILKVLVDLDQASGGKPPDAKAFAALESRRAAYDPKVLEAARQVLSSQAQAGVAGPEGPVIRVTLEGLRPGDRLAGGLETKSGQLLLSAGYEVTPALIGKLRNLSQIRDLKEPIAVVRAPQNDKDALPAA